MVQENSLKKVIVICGPTASGKTALAINLAKKLNTEIISADALYIYKGLDIGTAKPSIAEMSGVKHHLIDVIDATEEFSVSDYFDRAMPIINDLHAQNKIPIICGGTGFYINSLLFDLSYGKVAQNPDIRRKYEDLATEKGKEYVHSLLKEVDPVSAQEIHYNNLKRVIRALEIYEVSGTKKSDICDGNVKRFDYYAYALDFDKDVLYDRINKRVEIMVKKGLIDEVKKLLSNGVSRTAQSMQGIGYKEVFDYLDKKISLSELLEVIKINTRHYAKRQATFFRKLDGLKYLNPNEPNIEDVIINEIKNAR